MYRQSDYKEKILSFIDELSVSHATTNHSLAFEHSFINLKNYLRTKVNEEPFPVMLLYISRGLLPFTESRQVFETISNGQRILPYPILINTIGVFG